MRDKISAFDMDEFIQFNHQNAVNSLKVLREQNFWMHFGVLFNFYGDLVNTGDSSKLDSHLKMAWSHFLLGNSVNLAKGVSCVLAGHFTDSSIYARRSIESIRYSTFLREKSDSAESWFHSNSKTEFNKSYKKWMDTCGRQVVEAEFPDSTRYFEHASNFGSHSNAQLFSEQHEVAFGDGTVNFRILYHDLEPSERGYLKLLGCYFWHLKIHCSSITWWIRHSTFVNHLSSAQRTSWSDCQQAIEKDFELARDLTAKVQ